MRIGVNPPWAACRGAAVAARARGPPSPASGSAPRWTRRIGRSCAAMAAKSPVGLGVDELAEGVRPARDRAVVGVVGGELEEPADRGAALVELAGRVQEARPVAGRGRAPRRVAEQGPDAAEGRVAAPRVGAMNAWRARYAFGRRRRGGADAATRPSVAELPDHVGREAGRRGRRSAAASVPAPLPPPASRTSRVSCLASSTLGWSNGSMPRTTPAIAVATSQRTNSPPRSIGSSSVDPDDRVAGGLEGVGERRRGRRRCRPVERRGGRRRGRRRRPRARRAARRSTGTIPTPCLPVLSAMSCSPTRRTRRARRREEGQLVAAGHGQGADREPERHAGVGGRIGLAAGAEHRRSPRRGARRGRGRSATPARGRRR